MSFIVGTSGAEKSTLLNILSLQEKCSSGSLLIEEFDVYQNIVIGLEIHGIIPNQEDVIQVLNRLNLPENILYEKIYNLIGGQRQRVAIARVLIKNHICFPMRSLITTIVNYSSFKKNK